MAAVVRLTRYRNLYFSRRSRNFRERLDILNIYSDDEFLARFRFSKNCVILLLNEVEEELESETERSFALSPLYKLLIFLCFAACGSYQQVVGDTLMVS